MTTTERTQYIYFDPEDAELDNGFGWNVVDTYSAIAARFFTKQDAIDFCITAGMPYTIDEGSG